MVSLLRGYRHFSYVLSLPEQYSVSFFFLRIRPPPTSTLFPYPTLFRSPSAGRRRARRRLARALDVLRRAGAEVRIEESISPEHLVELARRARDKNPDVVVSAGGDRSEEHTSELQSRLHLVCRLLLEKKK